MVCEFQRVAAGDLICQLVEPAAGLLCAETSRMCSQPAILREGNRRMGSLLGSPRAGCLGRAAQTRAEMFPNSVYRSDHGGAGSSDLDCEASVLKTWHRCRSASARRRPAHREYRYKKKCSASPDGWTGIRPVEQVARDCGSGGRGRYPQLRREPASTWQHVHGEL